ncbi:hypothetical protein PP175_15720 [Aneurinibacillus sp. Ricciae_BoGa-3]|uniref:DUF6115 domain-containing protein n=1 Tax=Aneurinibacillus sp. Ricciae_BoGa-3 TaxID=3022697 RepID=UPI00233FF165|nr:hypothetical protein [Aneurinibacillus sp. Ricciae_BoGa-3]WCK52869.1 hypothetical protein PP175_15720 [Aneurinibacillus sp. Ricciae_BoGa-3]
MWIQIWLGIVTILLVVLFMWILRRQAPNADSVLQDEMESFFAEFERENNEMLEAIARFKQNMTMQLNGQAADLNSLREQVTALHSQCEELRSLMEGKEPLPEMVEDRETHQPSALSFLRDDYKEIPPLYHSGFSVPDIARKLGLGSGEVEMVVQMLKKNQEKG